MLRGRPLPPGNVHLRAPLPRQYRQGSAKWDLTGLCSYGIYSYTALDMPSLLFKPSERPLSRTVAIVDPPTSAQVAVRDQAPPSLKVLATARGGAKQPSLSVAPRLTRLLLFGPPRKPNRSPLDDGCRHAQTSAGPPE